MFSMSRPGASPAAAQENSTAAVKQASTFERNFTGRFLSSLKLISVLNQSKHLWRYDKFLLL